MIGIRRTFDILGNFAVIEIVNVKGCYKILGRCKDPSILAVFRILQVAIRVISSLFLLFLFCILSINYR